MHHCVSARKHCPFFLTTVKTLCRCNLASDGKKKKRRRRNQNDLGLATRPHKEKRRRNTYYVFVLGNFANDKKN